MREIAIGGEGQVVGLSVEKGNYGGYLLRKWNAEEEEWMEEGGFAPEKIAIGREG